MSTSDEVRAHLTGLQRATAAAMQTVADYQGHAHQYTSAVQTSERAKVTTVNSRFIHASDCSICTSWDGS